MKINFNLKQTLAKYRRVLILARKPSKKELLKISQVCGLGFFIIGFIGFIFYMISILGGA